jgi:hypothetical protein
MLSCARVLSCVAACAQDLVCQGACRAAGSTAARSAFDSFGGCVALRCASGDGGSGDCTSAIDTEPACQTCLSRVAAQAPVAGSDCHAEYVDCATS